MSVHDNQPGYAGDDRPDLLSAEMRAAIERAFPGETLGAAAPTFGGYSNVSVVLPVGARLLVAKIAYTQLKRTDVRREARVLTALQTSDLPIPRLVALLEEENSTIELLDYIPGTNGMRFFSADQEQLPALFAAVGQTLGAVHGYTLDDKGHDLDLTARYEEVRHSLASSGLPTHISASLSHALIHPIWLQTADRLVHGDAGLHNILWDGQLRALLDWEWAGRGMPLLDLAWTAWIVRFRELPPTLWEAFLAAYTASADAPPKATPDEVRALALGQVAAILGRAVPGSWSHSEWLRRAELSLDFAFPAIP